MSKDIPYSYLKLLEEINPLLEGTKEYFLYPGMEFGSRKKWWPDKGMRPTSHEGIDLCYFRKSRRGKEELAFSKEILVPVMASGKIAAICRDFLGYSLFLDHQLDMEERFLSVYAHIVPKKTLSAGQSLSPGDIIGNIADTTGRKNRMPAHLHLSIMKVARKAPAEIFDWNRFIGSPLVQLIDPFNYIISNKVVFRNKKT